MFTGIVEELGTIESIAPNDGGVRLMIRATKVLDDVTMGASIAVNGCCLTVVDFAKGLGQSAGDGTGDGMGDGMGTWSADAVVETMQRTNLGDLVIGDQVNLERPVRLVDRLGGHLVQGHVDATGVVSSRDTQSDGSELVCINAPSAVLRFVVEKGSITIDGVSLTVVQPSADGFSVALIPHTQLVTTLGTRRVGARLNLEVDVIAKYVERLLQGGDQ